MAQQLMEEGKAAMVASKFFGCSRAHHRDDAVCDDPSEDDPFEGGAYNEDGLLCVTAPEGIRELFGPFVCCMHFLLSCMLDG